LVLLLAAGLTTSGAAHAQRTQPIARQATKNAAAQKGLQPTAPTGVVQAGGKVAMLDVLPQNVVGFGVVRNLGDLDSKLSNLAKDLQLPAPGALATIRALSGIQEGLEEKGSLIAAMVAGDQGGPPLAFLYVPVSDYKKFVAQLQPEEQSGKPSTVIIANQRFAIAQKGNYAVLIDADHAERLGDLNKKTGAAVIIPPELANWAGEQDAYVAFMPEAIKRALGMVRQGLQQAKASFPADNEQLRGVAAIFDVYDKMLGTIESEVTHFALGLRIDQGSLFLNSHSVFLPNGSLAQAAGSVKTTGQEAIASIPAGDYVMAFAGAFPEEWFKGFSQFSAQAMQMFTPPGGEKLSDEQIKQMVQAMQESMRGIKSMAFRIGPLREGDSVYGSMSAALEVDNAQEYITRYEKSIREMTAAFKDNPLFKSYVISKATVNGKPVLQISMDVQAMLGAANQPGAEQMIKLLAGDDGKITAYVTPADADTVAFGYSKQALNEVLQSAQKKNGFSTQPMAGATMKLLPKDAQWVAFFNPHGILQFGLAIAKRAAPDSQVQLPDFPQTPPVGFGARVTEQGFNTSLVVPKEVLTAASQYAQKVQQLHAGGQQ
jgi:hypothetical protein